MRGRNSDVRKVLRPTLIENTRQRAFEIGQRLGACIECGQRIDQHDLPVQPREVIAEERAHHDVLVGFIAPPHHRP